MPEPDELAAARAVRRATLRLSRRLHAERDEHALSLTKISVLGHLTRRGPLTAGALAAADRLKPQSLTRVLAELEEAGLIARTPDVDDRRQRRFRLTGAGRRAAEADMRARDEWLAAAMSRTLTPTERDLLLLAATLIDKLADDSTS
ncbi:MarR family winged helix-turn-helix transcriptional regulator [Virgisporangium aurantiacum]|uniref:MarR family transcriptional regulator n=1 Tax=Virgisporangium aurantiacum TaxID=175570 RepID=A0A8J4DYF4_9ACTN|nr:MarR family transcriptional regulator [Virgisporangium aurantiacum]GIJ54864.1 MarR family transcriptional regulator [Virgisporangium aurantiacum]